MSDSAVEIKGAAARLAAAMPSGGKRLTMEFGTWASTTRRST